MVIRCGRTWGCETNLRPGIRNPVAGRVLEACASVTCMMVAIVKPAAGLCAHFDRLGKCAIRSVPGHVFKLLRCALIGIAQLLSFEGKVRL
jgi:hypothetical protein